MKMVNQSLHVPIIFEMNHQQIFNANHVHAVSEDTAYLNAYAQRTAPFVREAVDVKNKIVVQRNVYVLVIMHNVIL